MKYSKKGFTLVELLAVIVILAIILAIAIPGIGAIIKNAQTASYNSQLGMIKKAANLYVSQYGDSSTTSVSLDQLISKGLISSGIVNPITKQPFGNIIVDVSGRSNPSEYVIYEGPELATGMIPVYYDEEEGRWEKADKTNIDNNWYNYNNIKWANVVTVRFSANGTDTDGIPNKNRSDYLSAEAGTPISIDDINIMFVWIPRYSYLIPAGEGAREIKVKFETKYTSKSNGDAVNTYYTHPAFTFEDTEVGGIWVGKFETSGLMTSPTIIPNKASLGGQAVKKVFDDIKSNMQGSSTYGFSNDNDIHSMKNTEWGAVAYLSQSKYGKYGNPDYEGAEKEIYKNNSSSYYAGRSGGRPGYALGYNTAEGCFTYDGIIKVNNAACDSSGNFDLATGESVGSKLNSDRLHLAYGASTTGNIYGIYDMSGGAAELVMGMYKPNELTGIRDCSGYSVDYAPTACPSAEPYNSQYDYLTIDTKYYNKYIDIESSIGHIKGDATYEVAGWYGDSTTFCDNLLPWFIRGGAYDSTVASAGICLLGNTRV